MQSRPLSIRLLGRARSSAIFATPGQKRAFETYDLVLLLVVMVFAVGTRLPTWNRPFERDPEGCGAFYGILARNFHRYGTLQHYFSPIQSIGYGRDATAVYYPNHPPLLPLLIATTYGVFGFDATSGAIPPDWQTRLPTVLCTFGCIITIFLILRWRAGPRCAAIAAFIFAAMPITLMFGSQPDVINTQLVLFALLTVWAYLPFHEEPNWRRLGMLCLAFAPAAATDWPAFYLAPVLGLHFVLTHRVRQWFWIVMFGMVTVGLFALMYAPGALVKHDWQWMSKLVARRTVSDLTDSRERITMAVWIKGALLGHMMHLHTPIAAVLGAAWIGLATMRRPRGLRDHPATLPVALLLAWATLHVLVGRQGVFVHEWWWWPLTPGIAMAAALVIEWILRGLSLRFHRPAVPWITNTTAVLALVLFAILHGRPVFAELSRFRGISPGPDDYSITEIGAAIRAAAPVNKAVIIVEKDNTLPLWFYGDRPIMWDVWDTRTLHERIARKLCDSPFDLHEPWPNPPVAVVVPRAYLQVTEELRSQLEARYPVRESAKFLTFDLSAAAPFRRE